MSTALAIGAVSAVLRNILDNGLVDAAVAVGAPVKVSALAPDAIKLDDPNAQPQLNLFLYRVTPNLGYRNAGLPSRDGANRLTNPPLALDLHYLLTAYGHADLHAEILLGYAMHLLHERPFLDRETVSRALSFTPLDPTILPDAFREPPAANLAEQVESLRISSEPMDTEELSRLWSATQAHYRPSSAYEISVVLIEATRPATSPLPVLTHSVEVAPALVPPYPTITSVEPPEGREVAELGDIVTLRGHHLDGASAVVRFSHRLVAPHEIPMGTLTDPDAIQVALPTGAGADTDWPAGIWSVSASMLRPPDTSSRQTNSVAMLLAPTPDLSAAAITRDTATGAVTATLDVTPAARPEQVAMLAVGSSEAIAPARTASASRLTFTFGPLPTGPAWARLRVDGVESALVDRSATPPTFLADRSVTVP
ncbi:DUF4255 domain-containing protein [Nocardia sp. bgisy134]|uniref:DUF4255 domain-containing protein n=1 Tax=Nocardia sp. bgisy134 TaxID=3413789 RepID=UPI003D70C52B